MDEKTGKFPSDMIFDLLRHSKDKASITALLKVRGKRLRIEIEKELSIEHLQLIRQYGISISDPRLKPMMDRICSYVTNCTLNSISHRLTDTNSFTVKMFSLIQHGN